MLDFRVNWLDLGEKLEYEEKYGYYLFINDIWSYEKENLWKYKKEKKERWGKLMFNGWVKEEKLLVVINIIVRKLRRWRGDCNVLEKRE